MVGKEVGVLFEKPGRLPGQMVGKSDHLHAVHVEADGLNPGDLRRVKIIGSGRNSLKGALAK
jgi:tRNA-2-methylthio-N6-dimethylallyladenosine synthase